MDQVCRALSTIWSTTKPIHLPFLNVTVGIYLIIFSWQKSQPRKHRYVPWQHLCHSKFLIFSLHLWYPNCPAKMSFELISSLLKSKERKTFQRKCKEMQKAKAKRKKKKDRLHPDGLHPSLRQLYLFYYLCVIQRTIVGYATRSRVRCIWVLHYIRSLYLININSITI